MSDPLTVHVYIRNMRGDQQDVPSVWYHDERAGGPAIRRGVTLCLAWAPFNAKSPDQGYPRETDYKPLTPARGAHFAPDESRRTLATGEAFKAFTFDLRDWFNVDKPGHYEFRYKFDRDAMGLPGEPVWTGAIIYGFNIGTPPKRLTAEEVNREIPPLGGPDKEQQLRTIIRASLPPKATEPSRRTARPDEIFPWSKPAGGLVARIEYVASGGELGLTVLVRLKNVSDKVLVVPTGNPADSRKARVFELYEQREGRPWARRPWFPPERLKGDGLDTRSEGAAYPRCGAALSGNNCDRPAVALKPGETCLAYLCGMEALDERQWNADFTEAAAIKVILRQPATKENDRWQGVLETLPHPPRMLPEPLESLEGSLPMPEHFPALSRVGFSGFQGSGEEPEVWRLHLSNWELVTALTLYEHAGVRREFEQRMSAEKDLPAKLLAAALAARAGSQAAALCLLEAMKDTDYTAVTNVQSALQVVLMAYPADPPDWIVELVLAALSDQRYATGPKAAFWGGGTPSTISRVANENTTSLTYNLGFSKCRKAVPFLIEKAKRSKDDRGTIFALGEIGDPQAIPVLMQLLQRAGENAEQSEAAGTLRDIAEALAKLRAKETVPLLLEHVEFPRVVEALEKIGDPRAVPAIRKLVADRGRVVHNGEAVRPKANQERYFAARLALAALDSRDPIPQLCEMLGDKSLDKYQRRAVLWRLGERRDARAIPHLIHVIKTDPSGEARYAAIGALSAFKYKAAVEGLIECFDTDFRRASGFAMAITLHNFRDDVAKSLRSITGQPFGVEKGQWLKWWREKGMSSSELK
jgi:HEAT repeat protein